MVWILNIRLLFFSTIEVFLLPVSEKITGSKFQIKEMVVRGENNLNRNHFSRDFNINPDLYKYCVRFSAVAS